MNDRVHVAKSISPVVLDLDTRAELYFWAWAPTTSSEPDGTFKAVVKACYHDPRIGRERRDMVAFEPGYPNPNVAKKRARELRRVVSEQNPHLKGICL
jgi:hypothetical protein